ncbi:Uncharacterised protein [Moraxella caprae]|uniref:Uncharacterized protein n=1 Tax=Moraxella caprae TaxID=90240 RepID=A0A378QZC6_9GAMM|nr:Uncharacterised protein [Moraxella caprae]
MTGRVADIGRDVTKIIGDDVGISELLGDDKITNLALPIGKQHSKIFVIISTIFVVVFIIITILYLFLLLMFDNKNIWWLMIFIALISFTILIFNQHKNGLKDVLIDGNKITVIKRSPFNFKNNRTQVIHFKDIYHSYIECITILQFDAINYCHYLVMIEHITYSDDGLFYKKKRFAVRDFRTNYDKASEYLILLKSLLEHYHKNNGGKAHLPTIEFIPQR